MLASVLRHVWVIWALFMTVLLLLSAALLVLLLPTVAMRRASCRRAARAYLWACGFQFSVRGLQHMPEGPCVVVANHSSYIDGPLLFGALPPRFGFVIKKEASRIPVAGPLLRRLGHEFVERFNRHEGASDARRIMKWVLQGNSVAFFPEGTFSATVGIARFHTGAFVTAQRSGIPVVPVAISGARQVLPAQAWWPRRARLDVEILPALPHSEDEHATARLRDESRSAIAAALGEPLL